MPMCDYLLALRVQPLQKLAIHKHQPQLDLTSFICCLILPASTAVQFITCLECVQASTALSLNTLLRLPSL